MSSALPTSDVTVAVLDSPVPSSSSPSSQSADSSVTSPSRDTVTATRWAAVAPASITWAPSVTSRSDWPSHESFTAASSLSAWTDTTDSPSPKANSSTSS